jgi:hypothetical protein
VDDASAALVVLQLTAPLAAGDGTFASQVFEQHVLTRTDAAGVLRYLQDHRDNPFDVVLQLRVGPNTVHDIVTADINARVLATDAEVTAFQRVFPGWCITSCGAESASLVNALLPLVREYSRLCQERLEKDAAIRLLQTESLDPSRVIAAERTYLAKQIACVLAVQAGGIS